MIMRCTLLLLAASLGGASVARRAVLRLAGASLAASPLPSLALFESPEQLALIGLATAQPKLRGLIAEVTEVKRKRVKMAADAEDDAYVLRFSRAILDPAAVQMKEAAPGVKSERASALPGEFSSSITALDTACRAKSAADELAALESADAALNELLELARKQKFDVAPRDDINSYEGATGVLYNKFIFRSG